MPFPSRQFSIGPYLYTAFALLESIRIYLFPYAGSIISQGIYGVYMLLTVYYLFKALSGSRFPPAVRSLGFCVILFFIYGLILWIYPADFSWLRRAGGRFFIESFCLSSVPVFIYYYFARCQMIDEKFWRIVTPVLFVVAIYHFKMEGMVRIGRANRDEITNNAGYVMLSLFPILAFWNRKPVVLFSGLAILMAFILAGMKRGAILCGGLVVVYFLYFMLNKSSLRMKIVVIAASCVLAFFMVKYVNQLLESSRYFNSRLQQTLEGNSSGRDVIYRRYISYFFNESNPFRFLFGNGAYGTCHYLGKMAHNDWLEILIDTGLVGGLSYLAYWIRNFKMWRNSHRCCPVEISLAIGAFVIIFFMQSWFSMSIMSMPVYATSVFGYCCAKYNDNVEQKWISQLEK